MNSALEKAWTDVAPQLRGYIRTRVRDHATAEDILQDVFLKAQTRAAQLESAEKISGWLFLIARNAVIDHFRTTGRKAQLTEELPAEFELQIEEEKSSL